VKEGVTWSVFGCTETSAGGFTNNISQVITGVIGGLGFLGFLYGGFLLLVSQGDPERIGRGKKIITGSVVAVLIVVFAVAILQFAGEQVGIPGFGG
jgi:hypothetical protein